MGIEIKGVHRWLIELHGGADRFISSDSANKENPVNQTGSRTIEAGVVLWCSIEQRGGDIRGVSYWLSSTIVVAIVCVDSSSLPILF